jgi:hypothetical protein
MNKLWYGLSLSVGLALVTLGCVNKEQLPIFYTLETEEPVEENRGLPGDLSAFKMVNTGTRYFLAAGTLFTRLPGSGTTWSAIDPPVSGALCNTIELYDDGGGSLLYAGWFDKDSGDGLGLYTLDPAAGSWSAGSWTAQTNGGATGGGVQIGLLKDVGASSLLVATSTAPNSHTLHYYDVADFDGPGDAPLVASSSASFADADYDGSNYWVVTGRQIYTGTPGAMAAPPSTPSTAGDPSAAFGGVLAVDLTHVYVSSQGGTLYFSGDAGTSWSNSDTSPIQVDSKDVPFTRFVNVDSVIAGQIYAGTGGYGYYVIPSSGAIASGGLSRKPPSNISGLYNGAINSFLLDTGSTPTSLFVCTSGAGLWRGDFSAGDWIWKQEKDAN